MILIKTNILLLLSLELRESLYKEAVELQHNNPYSASHYNFSTAEIINDLLDYLTQLKNSGNAVDVLLGNPVGSMITSLCVYLQDYETMTDHALQTFKDIRSYLEFWVLAICHEYDKVYWSSWMDKKNYPCILHKIYNSCLSLPLYINPEENFYEYVSQCVLKRMLLGLITSNLIKYSDFCKGDNYKVFKIDGMNYYLGVDDVWQNLKLWNTLYTKVNGKYTKINMGQTIQGTDNSVELYSQQWT